MAEVISDREAGGKGRERKPIPWAGKVWVGRGETCWEAPQVLSKTCSEFL